MKKTAFIMMAILTLMAAVGTTISCGPSAEEQARLDSIRRADSIIQANTWADDLGKMEKAAEAAEENADSLELVNVRDFITDMIESESCYSRTFLTRHCDPALLKKLHDAYDLPGAHSDDYASWLFTAQSEEDGDARVLEVKRTSREDWYTYRYSYGGKKGSHEICIKIAGDSTKILDLK